MASIEYVCRKCNSKNITIKQAGKQTGIYCKDCGAWIQWLTQKQIREVYKKIKEENDGNGKVFRHFVRRDDGTTIVKCSGCNCQLYNSMAPEPIGQFNLLNAKYCPKCGAELF